MESFDAEFIWWFDLTLVDPSPLITTLQDFKLGCVSGADAASNFVMPVLRTSQKVYKFVGNPGHQSPEYSN